MIAAIVATILVIIAFFTALYFFVLPNHIKNKVFGINNADTPAKEL